MDAGSPEGLGTWETLIRIGLLNSTVAGGLPVEECGVPLYGYGAYRVTRVAVLHNSRFNRLLNRAHEPFHFSICLRPFGG